MIDSATSSSVWKRAAEAFSAAFGQDCQTAGGTLHIVVLLPSQPLCRWGLDREPHGTGDSAEPRTFPCRTAGKRCRAADTGSKLGHVRDLKT